MDFALSKQQEMLRTMVREFAETELSPKALALDEKGVFPFKEARRAAELGLVGMITSRKYGGSEMGHVARVIAIEEVSRVYPPLGFFLEVAPIAMNVLETVGNEEQKTKYLPSLCKGEKMMATAVTEATGGSEPATLQASARLDGDAYVVNGRKLFISLAEVADLFCLVARSGDGFNAFILEKGTPGFEVTRSERHFGLRSIPVSEFSLTDCRIPRKNLLGEEGRGLTITLNGIAVAGRVGVAATGVGVAQGSYEAALRFARERKLYGKPIAELQAIQFMLVDMKVGIETARLLAYKTGWLLDQGKTAREVGVDVAAAKLYACAVANRAAFKAVEILGGYGTAPEHHVIRRLRDAVELLAAAGTQEVMKVIIGGSITR